MYRLWETPPDSVTVGGETIPIHTDFRRWILVLNLLEDSEVLPAKKEQILPVLVCRDNNVEVTDELITELLKFAALGELPDGESGAEPEKVFDFEEDGERILASFRQAYGIDLTTETLHWHTFMTLLRHLPPETEFMRTVRLRMTDAAEIEDDRIRREVRRAKRRVSLKNK